MCLAGVCRMINEKCKNDSNGFDTMHGLLCVACIGLLSAEFSTVNTGLGRPLFWKLLCLLSIPKGLATTNYQLT